MKGGGTEKAAYLGYDFCKGMVFKLMQSVEKKRRVLNGDQITPHVIKRVKFVNGVDQQLQEKSRLKSLHQSPIATSRAEKNIVSK